MADCRHHAPAWQPAAVAAVVWLCLLPLPQAAVLSPTLPPALPSSITCRHSSNSSNSSSSSNGSIQEGAQSDCDSPRQDEADVMTTGYEDEVNMGTTVHEDGADMGSRPTDGHQRTAGQTSLDKGQHRKQGTARHHSAAMSTGERTEEEEEDGRSIFLDGRQDHTERSLDDRGPITLDGQRGTSRSTREVHSDHDQGPINLNGRQRKARSTMDGKGEDRGPITLGSSVLDNSLSAAAAAAEEARDMEIGGAMIVDSGGQGQHQHGPGLEKPALCANGCRSLGSTAVKSDNWKRLFPSDPLNTVLFPKPLNAAEVGTEASPPAAAVEVGECGRGAAFSCAGQCGTVRDLPCSCHVQCRLYRTCCEDFEDQCPETYPQLSWEEKRYLDADVQCPDSLLSPVMASCLQDLDPVSSMKCQRSVPVEISDSIPVTDKMTGIQFKNQHCALCNGVALSSLTPWSGEFFCKHVWYKVDRLFEAVMEGYDTTFGCLSRWRSPALNQSHGRCLPESWLQTGPMSCSNQTLHNCLTQPSSYLLATSGSSQVMYRNRHCLLCDSGQSQLTSCRPVQREEMDVSVQYFYSAELVWNENRTWTLWGHPGHSFVTYSMPFAALSCESTDLLPSHCHLLSCQQGFRKVNGSCINLGFITVWIEFHVPYWSSHQDVNATAVLEDLSPISYQLNSLSQKTIVSKQSTELEQGQQYWTFSVRIFTADEIVDTIHYIRDAALAVFERHGISTTRFCFQTKALRVTYKIPCLDYDTYVLKRRAEGITAAPAKSTRFYSRQPRDSQEKTPTWKKWTPITCAAASALSLAVGVMLELHNSLFRSSPDWPHFCLCLSFFLGYLMLLTGRLLPPASLQLCWLTAVSTHWAMLSGQLWVNSTALRIWARFRFDSSHQQGSSAKRARWGWYVHAWCSPLLVVAAAVALDRGDAGGVLGSVYGQGQGHCWIRKSHAALLLYVGPCLLLSLLDVAFGLQTVFTVSVARWTLETQLEDMPSSAFAEVRVCLMLAGLFGVTWLLGLPVVVYSEPILDAIFTVLHTSLGFLIILIFAGNRMSLKRARQQRREQEKQRKAVLTKNCPAIPTVTTSTSTNADLHTEASLPPACVDVSLP